MKYTLFVLGTLYINLILLGGLLMFNIKICNQIIPYTAMLSTISIPLIFLDFRRKK